MVAFCKQKNFHIMQQKAKISLLFKIDKGMEGFFLKEKERRKGRSVEQKASLSACMSARLLDYWISNH